MKILYNDTKNLEKNKACNYYSEIVDALNKYNNVTYISQKVGSLKNLSQLKLNNIDLIILGFNYTNVGDNNMPALIINDVNIPVVIILNKEYASLRQKLNWISDIKPKAVLTVHHEYKKYQEILKIPVHRIMWSAEYTHYKDYKESYKYDLFFSGVIRPEQTNNWRNIIYKNLHKLNKYKLNINGRFQENGYKGTHLSYIDYAKTLACSKICLSTTGPVDLVGTRYFEIMAGNRGLLICNRMENPEVYKDILIEDLNCIMFSTIDEFIEKVDYYLNHEEERMKIVNQAYKYFMENLTWDKHIIKVNNILRKYIK